MKFTQEYLKNDEWIEYPDVINLSQIISDFIRITYIYKDGVTDGIKETRYYFCYKLHRLDGPAFSRIYKNTELYHEWHVNGVYLYNWNNYYFHYNDTNLFKESLFRYAQKHPQFIKEIELLSRHNNWLNEKELDMLTCVNMFNTSP
jgi:hypothetical protein